MSKRLVVCCDGTWNKPDQLQDGRPAPTNVTKVARAVASSDSDGREQRMFYHEGVGTYWRERIWGGAFGAGLSRNVLDTYRFLVQNYEPGDEIFFFGFSRGAFTARSTVGLIRNSGILRPEHAELANQAYALYRDKNPRAAPDGIEAELFRHSYSYSLETRIRFVGVWDTVGALGIPLSRPRLIKWFNRRWGFHDTKLSTDVDAAFQALAIDEKRGPFQPAIWTQPDEQENPDRAKKAENQRLEQVWFAGVHCDVGGGYGESELAEITLLWMVDRAQSCGLVFEPGAFADLPSGCQCAGELRYTGRYVAPDPFGKRHESRKGLYLLSKAFERTPGSTDKHHEYVASSVAERREHCPEYRPANILTNADNTLPRMEVRTQTLNGTAGTKPERPRWLTGPCPSTCPWNRAGHGSSGHSPAGTSVVGASPVVISSGAVLSVTFPKR